MKKVAFVSLMVLFVVQGCCSTRSISTNRNSSKLGCGINYWSDVSYKAGDGAELLSSR